MEHRLAHRRMLICAAFFSFGAFSGALTVLRLSEATAKRVFFEVSSFFCFHPLFRIPAAAVLITLLLFLGGHGAAGAVAVCFLLSAIGFAGEFLEGLAMRAGSFPGLSFAFLIPVSVCFLQIGCTMLRKRHSHSGLRKTDRAYDSARAAVATAVLLLAAFVFALYLLNLRL